MGNQQTRNDIKFGKLIGRGSYGEVFEGTYKGRKVALKKLHGCFFQQGQGFLDNQWRREWDILSQLSHPNIVEYYDVILNPPVPPIIVLELCDGDLFHFIQSHKESGNGKVPFQDVINIMSDVAEGLKYLHGREPPIIHRDLASKNILLTANNRAKITDMGLSKAFPQGAMYATAGVGTPIYAAPETYPERLQSSGRFAQKAYYTEKVDIFSFGAMLLEVIIGRQPCIPLPDPLLDDGEVVPEYIRRSKDLYEMGPDHPLHSLVTGCLNNVPQDRPTAQELIDFLALYKIDNEQLNMSRKSISRSSSKSSLCYSESSHTMDYPIMRVKKDRFDYSFKIAVLGDSGVGKSSIIQRFINPETALSPITTLQHADFFERVQCLGKSVHLHIVDTPGEKRSTFHQAPNVVPVIYRSVNGAVVVFDVEDRRSFRDVKGWIEAIRTRSGQDTPIVLVGNKTDIESKSWKVSSQEAETFASSEGCLFYIETSALGLINIDEIFSILIARMIQEGSRKDEGEESTDWLLYQSPIKNSLLKGDKPPPYSFNSIANRASTKQLPSGNIKLGFTPENRITSPDNVQRNKKCGC